MIIYFKDKNNESKNRYKKYKTLTTKLKSFVTLVIIATTSSSVKMRLKGIGLIVIPISSSTTCGLTIGDKVIYEFIINKNNKYKKQYQKDQQTIKFFNKFYRKCLQDNVIDKNEYESLIKQKLNLFNTHEYKNKSKIFSVIIN